jgi:hypothetical protein
MLFPGLAIFLLVICLATALVAGTLTGVLMSSCLKLPMRGLWVDAVLGLFGFFFVFMAFAFLGPLQATVKSDEGPIKAGLVASAALPFIWEFSRFIRLRRRTQSSTPD